MPFDGAFEQRRGSFAARSGTSQLTATDASSTAAIASSAPSIALRSNQRDSIHHGFGPKGADGGTQHRGSAREGPPPTANRHG